MANNKLPFGLCKKFHIALPDNASPRDAWQALKDNGINYFEEESSEIVDPYTYLGNDDFDDRQHLTNCPTILLPKREYAKACAAISSKIRGKDVSGEIVTAWTDKYVYTAEVYEYGNYRFIKKRALK